ncbi:MAG: response regulator, partial [Chloroflexota bacterium]
DRETFATLVRDALAHLRNRYYLGKHPLASELGGTGRPLSGDALRDVLVARIEDLKPVGDAISQDADWRRFRHLVLRYEEGHTLEQAAHTLGISVRQATRDHHQAVEAICEALWSRRLENDSPPAAALDGEPGARADHGGSGDLAEEIAKVAGSEESSADLAETVEGVVATLEKLARENGVSFRPFVADALPPIAIGRTLLRQAILNLLIYTIEVVPGCQVLLAGTDTARGITLRILVQRIDGEFAVLPENVSPSAEVTELAAAARQLLEAQGGSIDLNGGPTGHPLVTLTLPPVQLRTVLVIDDNPELVALFRRYLRDQPYRVIQATSGTTAFRLTTQLKPDVIILDVMLPSQDGWEILQRLGQDPETRGIPIIMCSVLPEQALARSLGVAEFLPKPVTRPALLAALERWSPPEGGRQARS